jgi:DNA-binding NtrC family response regulator
VQRRHPRPVGTWPRHFRSLATAGRARPLLLLTRSPRAEEAAEAAGRGPFAYLAAERALLVEALRQKGGNQSEAAKVVGAGRTILWRKPRDVGLCVEKAS